MLLVGEIKKRGIESMALFGDLDFNSFVDWFATAGGFDVLLPFLLVFTIVFAILEKTNILGEDKKNFNVIIALVIGALLVSQTALVKIINWIVWWWRRVDWIYVFNCSNCFCNWNNMGFITYILFSRFAKLVSVG